MQSGAKLLWCSCNLAILSYVCMHACIHAWNAAVCEDSKWYKSADGHGEQYEMTWGMGAFPEETIHQLRAPIEYPSWGKRFFFLLGLPKINSVSLFNRANQPNEPVWQYAPGSMHKLLHISISLGYCTCFFDLCTYWWNQWKFTCWPLFNTH